MRPRAHLCIVRHGETDWNAQGILQGWTDVPLNALGRRQAADLAAQYAGHDFAAVWSSPLMRARETAETIARQLGLPAPGLHEGIKERHFGILQGVPKAELAELNPKILQQILRRNPAADFDGGESMDAVATRVLAGLCDIGNRHPAQRVLVVTHGWIMDVITRHTAGLPRDAILNLKRRNGEHIWLEADAHHCHAPEPGCRHCRD